MTLSIFLRSVLGMVLVGLTVSACARPQDDVLSPSQLNGDPAAFQHKSVIVRGYVTLEPEGHNLYESKTLNDEFRKGWDSGSPSFNQRNYAKYCLTIANPGLMYRNRDTLKGQTLVVKGTFLADYLTPKKIDLGACPLRTGLLIDMDDLKKRYPTLLPKP
jgi:hypothetical protein